MKVVLICKKYVIIYGYCLIVVSNNTKYVISFLNYDIGGKAIVPSEISPSDGCLVINNLININSILILLWVSCGKYVIKHYSISGNKFQR